MQPEPHSKDLRHDFRSGKDGVKRCRFCHQTKSRGGRVTPSSVPCPSLDRSIDKQPMETTPVNAFLIDLLDGAETQTTEDNQWEMNESASRLPFGRSV